MCFPPIRAPATLQEASVSVPLGERPAEDEAGLRCATWVFVEAFSTGAVLPASPLGQRTPEPSAPERCLSRQGGVVLPFFLWLLLCRLHSPHLCPLSLAYFSMSCPQGGPSWSPHPTPVGASTAPFFPSHSCPQAEGEGTRAVALKVPGQGLCLELWPWGPRRRAAVSSEKLPGLDSPVPLPSASGLGFDISCSGAPLSVPVPPHPH